MATTTTTLSKPIVEGLGNLPTQNTLRLSGSQPSRWEETAGKALRIFLQHAGYSPKAQNLSSDFLQTSIIPYLGQPPRENKISPTWMSFMTDDGGPFEFSWDWCGENGEPSVRFAIEPVGPKAGTAADPQNRIAGLECVHNLRKTCPGFNDVWFNHMAEQMMIYRDMSDTFVDVHGSRLFLGFDLSESGVLTKAYFTSKVAAAVLGQSDLQVIRSALAGLPGWCPKAQKAFDKFSPYFEKSRCTNQLSLEGFALDCINPSQSRIKLYIRGTDASLKSISDVVTLGGQLVSPILDKGMEEIRQLWILLFGEDNKIPPLNVSSDPRTAGIIYNYELRPGVSVPVPKVYIPVRHYCSSDDHVLTALQAFFDRYRGDGGSMYRYGDAMKNIFSPEHMTNVTGVQTYISCSFRPKGLKLAVYVNPQVDKMVYR